MGTITSFVLATAWTAYGVYPYALDKRLPDDKPPSGPTLTALCLSAARDEYETASFILRADADVAKFGVEPGALTGPGGATIPSEAVDVKVVKVWLQPRDAWLTERIYGLAGGDFRLTPNMLLHDDSLIRVDETNKINFLRIDYPDRSRYVDMMSRGRLSKFNYELHPVRDTPRFVPCVLQRNRFKQFWITVKVPADAKAGDYAGRLSFSVDGRPSGGVDLKLTVYPFALPGPRTHYDTSRKYVVSLMNGPSLGALVEDSHDVALSEAKLRAMCRSLVAHNVLNPFGPGDIAADDPDDFAVRSLIIWRQEGLPCDILFGGRAFAFLQEGFVGWPEKDPKGYADALAAFKKTIDLQLSATERVLGHRRRAFYGYDEASTQANRRQYESWRYIKSKGGEVFVTSPIARDVAWMVDWADVPANCSREGVDDWHVAGARVLNYAAPFAGATSPEIWRRTQGIRFYFADYDGLADLAWWSGVNRWNDNTWRKSEYQQMGMVYPTIDGVIDTLAYDALREAIDDIRYLTLHRRLAEKAGAADELAWVDRIEPEDVRDLDAFRAELASRSIRLMEKVGPLEPEPKLPPPPALKPYGGPVRPHPDDVDWLVGQLRRPEAVAILDAKLAAEGLPKAERGKLLLKKFDVLLSDMVFEEIFTKEQLDEAAAIMRQAFAIPGVSLDARCAAIFTLAERCNHSWRSELAATYIDEFLATVPGLDGARKCRLCLLLGRARRAQGDDKAALSALQEAERQDAATFKREKAYEFLSETAESLKNWKEAQRALLLHLPTISKRDYPNEYEGCKKHIVELSKRISGESSAPDAQADEELSLDE